MAKKTKPPKKPRPKPYGNHECVGIYDGMETKKRMLPKIPPSLSALRAHQRDNAINKLSNGLLDNSPFVHIKLSEKEVCMVDMSTVELEHPGFCLVAYRCECGRQWYEHTDSLSAHKIRAAALKVLPPRIAFTP